MITSNNEKELPDAFLRRCFFHYIRFPDREIMTQIVDVHFPELHDWLKLLMVEDMPPDALRSKDSKQLIPPLHGALLKNEQDVHLFERLAFMARREQRQ